MFQELKKERFKAIDNLSSSIYNLIIGACLLYGFLVNAIIVATCSQFFTDLNPLVLIIGYFVLCISGIFMSRSKSPLVSFLGYNLVVVPIGAVLSVSLPYYAMSDILSAIVITGVVVAVMMLLSTLFPNLFSRLGRVLFISLLVSLLAQLVASFFAFSGGVFNWIFVVIFALYIGYDWYRAQMYPKTLDNAIDCVLDLYLDIINLFLRILQIISRNRD